MSDEPRQHPPTEPLPPASEAAPTAPGARDCPEGVPPEEVAAWAVDGADDGPLDLAQHVPSCPACRAVARSVDRAAGLGDTLRGAGDVRLPDAVVEQALGRVRTERALRLLLGTLGGAFARVAVALPDLVAGRAPDPHRLAEPGSTGPAEAADPESAIRGGPDRDDA